MTNDGGSDNGDDDDDDDDNDDDDDGDDDDGDDDDGDDDDGDDDGGDDDNDDGDNDNDEEHDGAYWKARVPLSGRPLGRASRRAPQANTRSRPERRTTVEEQAVLSLAPRRISSSPINLFDTSRLSTLAARV
ncbi:hypothetical protein ALC56_01422 [Trachymyrmex septentrionalis]|uniref:Uncharacterized protein n=1 Tax=Trachymyrmex septentrionalis TaxID=34720 RepID=A0A195FUL1_9HYME|nr:hypothetical protein ALC56_01422 [Trachymyrmex septentrionalis]